MYEYITVHPEHRNVVDRSNFEHRKVLALEEIARNLNLLVIGKSVYSDDINEVFSERYDESYVD
jgi:hypothetical protein